VPPSKQLTDGNHRITIEELTVALNKTQEEVQDLARSMEALASETRDNFRSVSERMASAISDLSQRIAESHLDLSERISKGRETSWPVIWAAVGVAVPFIGMASTLVYFLFTVANKDIQRNEDTLSRLTEVSRRHNLEPWHPNAGSELVDIHEELERLERYRNESAALNRKLERQVAEQAAGLSSRIRNLEREAYGPPSRIDQIERLVPE